MVFYSDCVCRCSLSEGFLKGLHSTLILDGVVTSNSSQSHVLVTCASSSFLFFECFCVIADVSLLSAVCLVSRLINSR